MKSSEEKNSKEKSPEESKEININMKKCSSEIKKVVQLIIKDPGLVPKEYFVPAKSSIGSTYIEKPLSTTVGGSSNGIVNIRWDPECCAQNITLSDNNTLCFLTETGYCFRSVVGTTGIMGGIAYWEIHGDSRTENELKIGVVAKKNFNLNTVMFMI